jgi:D-glycero-D-manno-heptose 1,7-bisphosphate phosphatase
MENGRSKAVFLDRDQTLIHDPGYINHPDQVTLIEGVPEALNELKALGYLLVVVTNQSAVARGIVTEEVLQKIHDRMEALLAERGAQLDRIYYCPYHPDGVVEKYRRPSEYRKPNPGMFLTAAQEMDMDLDQSWCIGDSFSDIEAGVRAGCRTILIDGSSPPKRSMQGLPHGAPSPDYVAVNLREAVNIIKKFHRDSPMDSLQNKPETVHANKPFSPHQPALDRPATPTVVRPSVPPTAGPKSTPVPTALDDLSDDRTEQLLEDILGQLRDMHQGQVREDFSIMRTLAGVVQMAALACLVIALWKLTDQNISYEPVFTALGFAGILQIMALTFYTMNRR